jgi:hypothetical protein
MVIVQDGMKATEIIEFMLIGLSMMVLGIALSVSLL